MEIEKVNETLFAQAKALRMCDDVHRYWYGKTLPADELFSLYYKNLDFCLEYRWPGIKTLTEAFTDEERRRNGMLVNDKWSLLNPTHSVVIGWSKAKVRYNGFAVGRINIMDSSTCEIIAKGHAVVHVHILDRAKVNLIVEDTAMVSVYKHSNSCKCDITGKATVKECIIV